MAHDVFISYASADKTVADAVCASLEAHNIRCWIAPRDVLPGVAYGEAIIDAIQASRVMVLVFSSKANISGHIPKEIERAVSKGITVMPLRIEDVAPGKSLDYFIGSVHWLDALTPPLELHLQKLAMNVETLLSRSAANREPPSWPPIPLAAARGLSPAKSTHPASQHNWAYPAVGVLTAVVLVLAFLIFWFKSHDRSSTDNAANAPQTAANAKAVEPQHPVPPASPTNEPMRSEEPAKHAQHNLLPSVPATTPTRPSREIVLRYVPSSTTKLQQLVGEQDKERRQPTLNQTVTRYGLQGTDLGYSFEHQARTYFLFGDTVGRLDRALDTIATSDARDPEVGVHLDFLTNGTDYLTIQPPGISMGVLEVPVSGISLAGQIYVVVSTNQQGSTQKRSVLTRFVLPATFEPLRTISQLPTGRFIRMSMHVQPGTIAGLPPGGPYVLIWGTGQYRKSDAYLSIVPIAQFGSGKGTRYFAGLDAAGAPTWSEDESSAKPIVRDGTIGDLSVTWCKEVGRWLMTYDSRQPGSWGIVFLYSRTPWGPWSVPQIIFNPVRDGALSKFIHNPDAKPADGLAGPVFGPMNQANPTAVRGVPYAPYVVERWTKVRNSELDLYYVLSTWNPYVVVLMKSRLQVE